jgi:hypothetical protein
LAGDSFRSEATTMSSKKIEPATAPVFRTSLRYHLKPRPLDAEAEVKEIRKDRRSREQSRRRCRLSGDPRTPSRGGAIKAGERPGVQAKPEPVAGWVTRCEARKLLGIEETELVALIGRFRLRQSWVQVYSKPEILALRKFVDKLR